MSKGRRGTCVDKKYDCSVLFETISHRKVEMRGRGKRGVSVVNGGG